MVVRGVAAGGEDEAGAVGEGVDVEGGGVVGGEDGGFERVPLAVLRLDPAGAVVGLAGLAGGAAVAEEVLDEGVVALQQGAGGEGGEGGEALPGFFLGDEEPGGVGGAVAVGFGGDEEAVGFADFPVVVEEGLAAGALVAEPADADGGVVVEELDAAVLSRRRWGRPAGRGPRRRRSGVSCRWGVPECRNTPC